MHITVDMVFAKEYLRQFAFSLSERQDVLKFGDRSKLNRVIRSHLDIAYEYYKPPTGDKVTRIILPINGRHRNYPSTEILPQSSFKDVEQVFEDLFFSVFFRLDSAGLQKYGTRKEAREKYLATCGVTCELLTENAFRKLYDRFRNKMTSEIAEFMENPTFDLVIFYKSGIKKNHTHPTKK